MFWHLISSFWKFLENKKKKIIEDLWESQLPFSYILFQNLERIKRIRDYNLPLEFLCEYYGPIMIEKKDGLFISNEVFYVDKIFSDPFFKNEIKDYTILSESHNLIKNGGFEDWKDLPIFWQLISGEINRIETEFKNSVLLKGTIASQEIPIFKNLKYKVSFYAKKAEVNSIMIEKIYLSLNGSEIKREQHTFELTDNFARYEVDAQINQDCFLIISFSSESAIIDNVMVCQSEFLLPYTENRTKMLIIKLADDSIDKIYCPYGLRLDNLVDDFFPEHFKSGNWIDFKHSCERFAKRLRYYIKYLIEPTRRNLILTLHSFLGLPVLTGYILSIEDLNNHFYEKRIWINENGEEKYFNLIRGFPVPLSSFITPDFAIGKYFNDEIIIPFINYDLSRLNEYLEFQKYKVIPIRFPGWQFFTKRNIFFEQLDIPDKTLIEKFLYELTPVGFKTEIIEAYFKKELEIDVYIRYERLRKLLVNIYLAMQGSKEIACDTYISEMAFNYNVIMVDTYIEQPIESLWEVREAE